MSNLIISIIGIALIGLIAFATASYIGEAFQDSSEDAKIATLTSQVQQIHSAATLYYSIEGKLPESLSELTPNYIKEIPEQPFLGDGSKWEMDTVSKSGYQVLPDGSSIIEPYKYNAIRVNYSLDNSPITDEICNKINKKNTGVITCVNDPDDEDVFVEMKIGKKRYTFGLLG